MLTTVTDAQGRLVPNLEQEDFTILDNGKPQPITLFQNETQPFTVVVMLDFSFSMNNNLDLLKAATEQFILRMLPADKGQVGAFSDKIQFSGEFTNDRDDLVAALRDLQFGNPTRLYDAIDASIDIMDDVEGRKIVLVFTDGDDTASKKGMGAVLDKAKVTETMIYAIGLESEFAIAPGRMQRTRPDRGLRRAGRRDRRWLLRAEEDDRAGADVHESGGGAAQPVHDRLQPDAAGQQGAPARGQVEASRPHRPGAQELHRLRGPSERRQMTVTLSEQDFRLEADRALEHLQHALLPLADEHGFEVELQNGVLQIVFEDPSPAKFVVSPNAPVRQIWVSAMSRSYKLTWQPESSTFALDSESLDALIERLARLFLRSGLKFRTLSSDRIKRPMTKDHEPADQLQVFRYDRPSRRPIALTTRCGTYRTEQRNRPIHAAVDVDRRAGHHRLEPLTGDRRRVHPHPRRQRFFIWSRVPVTS